MLVHPVTVDDESESMELRTREMRLESSHDDQESEQDRGMHVVPNPSSFEVGIEVKGEILCLNDTLVTRVRSRVRAREGDGVRVRVCVCGDNGGGGDATSLGVVWRLLELRR